LNLKDFFGRRGLKVMGNNTCSIKPVTRNKTPGYNSHVYFMWREKKGRDLLLG
jgi:hypothetical protein